MTSESAASPAHSKGRLLYTAPALNQRLRTYLIRMSASLCGPQRLAAMLYSQFRDATEVQRSKQQGTENAERGGGPKSDAEQASTPIFNFSRSQTR